MRNKKLVIIILSILIFIMTISGIVFNQTLKTFNYMEILKLMKI